LIRQRSLRINDINNLLRPLVDQSEDHWTKGVAAYQLYHVGVLDSKTTSDILLRLANQDHLYQELKQEFAHQAAQLGQVEQATAILREIITDTSSGKTAEIEKVKDAAFKALQEAVTLKPKDETFTAYKRTR
jgi:hypothetical protein